MTKMQNTEFIPIKNKQDADCFIVRTNGLHDGYIISIQYDHPGHTGGNPHLINSELSELIIRIMVTSIYDAVVEIVFKTLSEWQIKDNTFGITDTFISFTSDGDIIWTDESSMELDSRINGSYVIAKEMKWRFL